ncbi:class I SAM-dependent methyltransferase [Sorangium sp. So ce204]|uniref:class I SAM-dependent methyltransferase n=1 Tax=Sorangium sp. So ce204 TaxID=3133288 RepID=UPI003F6322AB
MMNRARLYLPLAGFVIPTVVIGYGFVIPRSCIAGVNELTLGFATTMLGAVFTYVAGLRTALSEMQGAACSKPPLRIRLSRWVNRQAAHPRGVFGRFLGWNWTRETAAVNAATLDLLSIEPESRVLDLGCGPGVTLREAARRASRGSVVGLDVSNLMIATSRRCNRSGIREGRVEVRKADADDLTLEADAFDRIYSVHCIYFWSDPDRVLGQLAAALRPGGRLVLAFRPEGPSVPARFRDPTYRFYAPEDVIARLARVGLSSEVSKQSDDVVWIVAERP